MHGNVERLPVTQKKVAVLLNGNARAVTEQLRRELEQFVPPEDLFFSRSFEDARSIARTVLDRGYGTVLTGGGDGTFVGYVNCIYDEVARGQPHLFVRASGGSAAPLAASHSFQLPRFGVLRLGTGNALAEFAGASGRRLGVVEDILRTRSGEVSRARSLHLLCTEGKRAPFAGLGLDAAILNDFVAVKKGLVGRGKAGYFWAVATRKGVADFLCDSVRVEFDREMPFQIGGDAEGYRRELELSMCDQPLELLDFNCGPLLSARRSFATA